ncbi:MAG: hypothetical protein MZV63_11010 [Marinilabiliales bacterium]|nr:hypothetical protein [Marinilabiliales bacterium]
MKKVILGLAGVAMLALVVVLFVNAQSYPRRLKKPAKEAAMDCGKCPSATATTCAPKAGANGMQQVQSAILQNARNLVVILPNAKKANAILLPAKV